MDYSKDYEQSFVGIKYFVNALILAEVFMYLATVNRCSCKSFLPTGIVYTHEAVIAPMLYCICYFDKRETLPDHSQQDFGETMCNAKATCVVNGYDNNVLTYSMFFIWLKCCRRNQLLLHLEGKGSLGLGLRLIH